MAAFFFVINFNSMILSERLNSTPELGAEQILIQRWSARRLAQKKIPP